MSECGQLLSCHIGSVLLLFYYRSYEYGKHKSLHCVEYRRHTSRATRKSCLHYFKVSAQTGSTGRHRKYGIKYGIAVFVFKQPNLKPGPFMRVFLCLPNTKIRYKVRYRTYCDCWAMSGCVLTRCSIDACKLIRSPSGVFFLVHLSTCFSKSLLIHTIFLSLRYFCLLASIVKPFQYIGTIAE